MNANELKLHLDNYNEDSVCSKSEIGYVTLPLLMLSQNLFAKMNKLLETKYQLTHSELDVLASLQSSTESKQTLSPTKLYERLLFSSGGMTKVLKKLEQKKFIIRLDNKEDKRSKLVQLTKNGSDILNASLSDVIEMEEKMFAHVNTQNRESLSSLLFLALEEPQE